jgi:uncharacterized protein (TIGR03435 family)
VKLGLFLAIVPVAVMLGQSTGQPGQYKLINITPNTDTAPFAYLGIPVGPIKYRGATLKRLIMDAYGVRGFQITGGPRWVTTDRWDFEARADGPVVMSIEAHRQALLRLVESSFQLRAHRETIVMPIYELTKVGRGPNLREDAGLDARDPVIKNDSGSVRFRNTTMGKFANRLSLHLDRPVLDKTNTNGTFTFSLEWAPTPGEDGGPEAAGLPPGTPMPIVNSEGLRFSGQFRNNSDCAFSRRKVLSR